MARSPSSRALLAWYLEAGVDETIGEQPVDRYAATARRADRRPADTPPPDPPC